MTILKTDTVSGIGTEGTVFEGDITFDSLNYMTLPKGTTTESNRGRGIIGGGYVSGANTDVVDYIHIPTGGYANTFGTLTDARSSLAGCASATRALFAGGSDPASSNIIDYITISTTGAAINFGDLSQSAYYCESLSNNTRGLFFGMADAPSNSPHGTNTIDYVTIASAGNTSNFGDLLVRKYNDAGLSSPTRGVMGGGWDAPAYTNVIEYVTIATAGNSADFGDLATAAAQHATGHSTTRGLWAGGAASPAKINTISYITIATTGNSSDFGDLSNTYADQSGASTHLRTVIITGWDAAASPAVYYTNVVEYITIATTGNAKDWGDLSRLVRGQQSTSNSHGGLSE